MSKDEEGEEGSKTEANPRNGNRASLSTVSQPVFRKKIRSLDDHWEHSGSYCRNLISLNKRIAPPYCVGSPSRPQDADYPPYVPPLNDELGLLILARVARSDHPNLQLVNRRYRSLVRSGELYSIRRKNSIREPSVLMLASGEPNWWSYDPKSGSRRKLPVLPSDTCFSSFDKETVCAGTHLLVSGKEASGAVIWRYELVKNRWYKGPPMMNSRCLFASANCGNVACVAGGLRACVAEQEVLNSAEEYNPESKTWDPLPRMKKRRKLCAGCYMDGKFYVVGGQNEKQENLTCGEFYDPKKHCWELIPDMIKDDAPSWTSRSPPLLAVVDDELYFLEASSNQIKVYLKMTNSWKDLGRAPVGANHSRGWGVAFKSLGSELLIIGSRADNYNGRGMVICTCTPNPMADSLEWHMLGSVDRWSSFIFNCSIMMA